MPVLATVYGPCPVCRGVLAVRPTAGLLECPKCHALVLHPPGALAHLPKEMPAWPHDGSK